MGPYLPGQPGLEEAFARLEAREQKSEVRDNGSGRMLVATRPDVLARSAGKAERRSLPPLGSRAIKIEVGRGGLVRVPLDDWFQRRFFLNGAGSGPAAAAPPRHEPRSTRALRDPRRSPRVPGGIPVHRLHRQEPLRREPGARAPEPQVELTRSGFRARAWIRARGDERALRALRGRKGPTPGSGTTPPKDRRGPSRSTCRSSDRASATVPVRIGLIGGSEHAHRVAALINGVPVGEVRFTGKTTSVLSRAIPLEALARDRQRAPPRIRSGGQHPRGSRPRVPGRDRPRHPPRRLGGRGGGALRRRLRRDPRSTSRASTTWS